MSASNGRTTDRDPRLRTGAYLGGAAVVGLIVGLLAPRRVTVTQLAVLAEAIAWPLAVVVVLLILERAGAVTALLRNAGARMRSLGIGGVSMEFTHEGASAAKGDIEEIFREYRTRLTAASDQQALALDVRGKLEQLLTRAVEPLLSPDARQYYRCTIHVPDALFEDSLYQLLDYYPKGEGAGRWYSNRFGILGVAWRRDEHQVQGVLEADPEVLIGAWGMTREEAVKAAGRGKESFCCAVIRDRGRRVGIVFLDAPARYSFRSDLAEQIELAADEVGLPQDLSVLLTHVRALGPSISTDAP